ncbi:lysophospholipid acyltransferase family protein [Actinomycetospora atypica]|uniref:Lysophospholipid acyltransferase family protein n=1 Tax=Actinomycetospora atypica TaxID=1290095 RepID=A0ABV9YK21_9PSEU
MSGLGRVPRSARARVAAVVLAVVPPLLTEPVVAVLAAATATAMRVLRRPGVALARENLRVVLGADVPPRRLERVLRESLRQYYAHWWSMLRMPALGVAGVSRAVTISGLDHLVPGRAALLVGAHMGRYEWSTAALSTAVRDRTGRPLLGVARLFDSPVTEAAISTVRAAGGNDDMHWIDPAARARSAGVLVRRLAEGGVVGVMIDRFSVGATAEVPMFGRRVVLAASPVAMAARTGAALHPMTCWIDDDGQVHFDVHPSVEVLHSSVLGEEERCRAALEAVAAAFEKEIGAHPEAWHVTSEIFR